MKKKRPYLKYLVNFYTIVGMIAIVWMVFFDRYNVVSMWKTQARINQLQSDFDYYNSEKEKIEERRAVLEQDPEELERYARERYWMKKENEDLFLLVEKKEK